LNEREGAFFSELFGDRSEADHVGEQRCHLPPLAGRRGWVRRSGGVAHRVLPSVSNSSVAWYFSRMIARRGPDTTARDQGASFRAVTTSASFAPFVMPLEDGRSLRIPSFAGTHRECLFRVGNSRTLSGLGIFAWATMAMD